MPKQSFRDLLNFRAITPIVDPGRDPKSDSDKVIKLVEDNRVKDDTKEKSVRVAPNDFFQNRISNVGKVNAHLSQSEIDAMNNWWGFKNTDAYKKIAPYINATDTVGTIINSVLGNGKNSYRFLSEILKNPRGNEYHKAVKNDREETLIAAVKSHIDAFKKDWKASKNFITSLKKKDEGEDEGAVIGSIWDPYTYKDYTNTNPYIGEYTDLQQLESISMPMSTLEVKELGKRVKSTIAEAKDEITSKRRGTLIFNKEKIKSAIFDTDDEILGWHIREFAIDSKIKDSIHKRYRSEGLYYKNLTSPYKSPTTIESPNEIMNYAKSMGFCNGYKDVAGFSLDSSHLWGITIVPYVFNGYYKSLAPPLPKYIIPTWTVENGTYICNESYLDYGSIPPVVSYSLNVGTSMEKDINLMNGGSFKIPVGFSYNYSLSLTFADDQHSSMKNYMMYYYNTIFRPEEGLMAPYELCSFLITLTSFKPGLKVKSQLKLICVPVAYSVSQGGESNPSGEMVQVGFSVVGMKTSSNYLTKVDNTLGGIWSKLNWNDVILRPVNNNKHIAPYDDWGKGDNMAQRWKNLHKDSDQGIVGTLPDTRVNDTIDETIPVNKVSDPYNLNDDKKFKRLIEKGKTDKARSYADKKSKLR